MISISKYVADEETYSRVLGVLESGRLSQGPQVAEFEELVAEISNCDYAVAVNNGTTAIEAMLRTIPSSLPERRVLTSPLTFRATVKAIQHAGHRPVFKDVFENTLCLDESFIGLCAEEVMTVDLYGRKAKTHWPLPYRDAAQGIGLDLSDSKASAISFYTTKNVGCGEGGAVVTNDKAIADRIRLLRNQGMGQHYRYESGDGFNWRMTELQAAVAIPQLKNIRKSNARREHTATTYSADFYHAGLEEAGLIRPLSGDTVWHQYTLRHPKRDQIVAMLRLNGIDARVYYPELVSPRDEWEQTPVALQATKEVFSIPVHQYLTADEVDYISATVIEVVKAVDND